MKYFTNEFYELVDNTEEDVKRKSMMEDMRLRYWKSFDECSDRLHYNVAGYNSSINYLSGYAEIGDYIYGEILDSHDGCLTHEFSFYNSRNIIKIKFKRLSFKLFPNSKKLKNHEIGAC